MEFQGRTILIVEDDNNINNMLYELLTLNGYKTVQAYSGTEALLYISNNNIDLVILDLMIPGKDRKWSNKWDKKEQKYSNNSTNSNRWYKHKGWNTKSRSRRLYYKAFW